MTRHQVAEKCVQRHQRCSGADEGAQDSAVGVDEGVDEGA